MLGKQPQQVELFIRCRNLINKDTFFVGDKSDSFTIVFTRNAPGTKWQKVGQTEIIYDDLNPSYLTTFKFPLDSVATTQLKFMVYDVDAYQSEFIGATSVLLKDLVDNIEKETSVLLKSEKKKRGHTTGELLLTVRKENEGAKDSETRAALLAAAGFDLKQEAELKKKAADKVRKYIQDSGINTAFKIACAEIIEKNIPEDKAIGYTAKRLRELGEMVAKIVRITKKLGFHLISFKKQKTVPTSTPRDSEA